MKVYFAADHAGFDLKNRLINYVRGDMGLTVEDCGAFELDSEDDYPDMIASASRRLMQDVHDGIDSRAILLGGSGQGEAIVANRYPGVRAIVYYGSAGTQMDASGNSFDIITSSRKHNNANVLSIGARFVNEGDAKQVVRAWLMATFSGDERHVRRIKKIDSLDDIS